MNTLSRHSPQKETIPSQTLSLWHKRGLLRYQEFGVPDPDSAAALFIARMTDTRKRNWLPSLVLEEEPHWWCWRQDTPDAVPVPCPIPLPQDIPPSALLWTPWIGAIWNRSWIRLDHNRGAIRWAGVQVVEGKAKWHITTESLAQWDPQVMALFPSAHGKEQMLQCGVPGHECP